MEMYRVTGGYDGNDEWLVIDRKFDNLDDALDYESGYVGILDWTGVEELDKE